MIRATGRSEVEAGPNVVVHRTDGGQWYVGILTEDMDPDTEHTEAGEPCVCVSLNDADIYDKALPSAEELLARARALDQLADHEADEADEERFRARAVRLYSAAAGSVTP